MLRIIPFLAVAGVLALAGCAPGAPATGGSCTHQFITADDAKIVDGGAAPPEFPTVTPVPTCFAQGSALSIHGTDVLVTGAIWCGVSESVGTDIVGSIESALEASGWVAQEYGWTREFDLDDDSRGALPATVGEWSSSAYGANGECAGGTVTLQVQTPAS